MNDTFVEVVRRSKPTRPAFYAKCHAAGELFTGYGDNEWSALADAVGKAKERLAEVAAGNRLAGNPA